MIFGILWKRSECVEKRKPQTKLKIQAIFTELLNKICVFCELLLHHASPPPLFFLHLWLTLQEKVIIEFHHWTENNIIGSWLVVTGNGGKVVSSLVPTAGDWSAAPVSAVKFTFKDFSWGNKPWLYFPCAHAAIQLLQRTTPSSLIHHWHELIWCHSRRSKQYMSFQHPPYPLPFQFTPHPTHPSTPPPESLSHGWGCEADLTTEESNNLPCWTLNTIHYARQSMLHTQFSRHRHRHLPPTHTHLSTWTELPLPSVRQQGGCDIYILKVQRLHLGSAGGDMTEWNTCTTQ